VDLRADVDDLEKRKLLTLPGLELRPLGRPARNDYAIPAHKDDDLALLNYEIQMSENRMVQFTKTCQINQSQEQTNLAGSCKEGYASNRAVLKEYGSSVNVHMYFKLVVNVTWMGSA
jgi:hypothetical protein